MSYINVYEVDIDEVEGESGAITVDLTDDADHSYTDGEEMRGAAAIVRMIDALDNGEALVITRTVF